METVHSCYVSAAGEYTPVVAHYEYRQNAAGGTVVHAVRFTTSDGVPFDTVTNGGIVFSGSCPLGARDVEWEQLCDVSAAGVVTPFWRRIVYTYLNNVPLNTVTDYEVDKVTLYAVTGTVMACASDECDVVAPIGVVGTWG
jgi:hypothetical protein